MLNYIFVLIVSFSGVFAGHILALLAKEELKQGKRWFMLLEKIIFILILLVFSLYVFSVRKFILLAGVLAFLIYFRLSRTKIKQSLVYLGLGALLFLLSDSPVFTVEAALIFLYGLPLGSLLTYELRRKKEMVVLKELLIQYGIFLVVGIALPLLRLLLLL